MRVITGTARGTKLYTLSGEDVTRPTPEVVKEAVFSSIQFDIEGRTFLDLYAGSGQMGIEALSRGADRATFIDASRDAIGIINQNLQKTKLITKATVMCATAEQYVKTVRTRQAFDFVFLDPPYALRALPDALALIYDAGLIKPTGLVICEDEKYIDKDDERLSSRFELKKEARYGRVIISYLTPKGEEK